MADCRDCKHSEVLKWVGRTFCHALPDGVRDATAMLPRVCGERKLFAWKTELLESLTPEERFETYQTHQWMQ